MGETDLSYMWEHYELTDLQNRIEGMFPEFGFSLSDMLDRILAGDVIGALSDGLSSVISGMASEIGGIRNVLLSLLVLGIVSALLTHFTDIFENHQVADISFYLVYLLLMAVLFKCFWEVADTAEVATGNVVTFIKLFIPTYFVAVGVAGGVMTAMTGYQLLLVLIYVVEQVLISILMPFIYSYVMLSVINGIWVEERLSILLEFMHKCIGLVLKSALGVITGVSLFQSMITPVIDSVKSGSVQKAVSFLPGIGKVADGMAEIMLGSAVLIKNSIGVVFLIILVAICIVPLIKIFMIAGCLKVSAALMGIVSDKRIVGCTNKVGEGSFLLMKTTGTVMLLFVILIAIAAYTTNRGF